MRIRNRHIVCYVVLLIMMRALGCPISLLAQSAHYVNKEGTTVETRFMLPTGYERIPAVRNSYAYFLRHLRMLPYSTIYNNDPSENYQVSTLNLLLMDNIQHDIHLCIRLRGEYLFSQEQYDKMAFSIVIGRIFYVPWAKGLKLEINGKPYWTQQPAGIDYLTTFLNYLSFIFHHSDVNTILSDVYSISIDDIMPGDMFIQTRHPSAAVVVLDVATNPTTGDRIFLLARVHKSFQTVDVLVNPKEAWSGSPWYSTKTTDNKIIIPGFVFYKTNLWRFYENYPTTTEKKQPSPVFNTL